MLWQAEALARVESMPISVVCEPGHGAVLVLPHEIAPKSISVRIGKGVVIWSVAWLDAAAVPQGRIKIGAELNENSVIVPFVGLVVGEKYRVSVSVPGKVGFTEFVATRECADMDSAVG
jgi:hypothetical protein